MPREALALCRSSDEQARTYCLHLLESAPELDLTAHEALLELAAQPGRLGDRARAHHLRRYGKPAPSQPTQQTDGEAPDQERHESDARDVATDPTRIIFSPTAFTIGEGERYFQAHELGIYDLRFSPAENLELGVRTILPIGVVGGSAFARYSVPFKHGAFAVHGDVGGLAFIAWNDGSAVFGGGGAALSLGTRATSVTFGTAGYVGQAEGDLGAVLSTYAGVGHQLGPRARLNVELHIPFVKGSHEPFEFPKMALLLWGIRLGQQVWGDIAFIDPIYEGAADLYEVVPLGIPYLSFGMGF